MLKTTLVATFTAGCLLATIPSAMASPADNAAQQDCGTLKVALENLIPEAKQGPISQAHIQWRVQMLSSQAARTNLPSVDRVLRQAGSTALSQQISQRAVECGIASKDTTPQNFLGFGNQQLNSSSL